MYKYNYNKLYEKTFFDKIDLKKKLMKKFLPKFKCIMTNNTNNKCSHRFIC